MAKNDFKPSRSSRKKDQRLDRFLNWAIVVVIVCIVIVGGYLLVSVLRSPSQSASNDHHVSAENKKQPSKNQSNQNKNKNQSGENASDDHSSSDNKADGDASNSDDGQEQQNDEDSETGDISGGGPNGPWEPIGTQQKGEHQKSYDMGSTDWNEQVKALSYATGIPTSDMTIIWLGNGGGPDLSKGTVRDKKDPSKKYDVQLQWVKDKGWKPISVVPD